MSSVSMPLDQIACSRSGSRSNQRALLASDQRAAASPYETADDSAFGPAVMWSAIYTALSGKASAERSQ
jgi:hypothetical protein